MDNKGMVGIAVLWILTAVSALALAVLQTAKSHESRSHYRWLEIQANYLVCSAALLERESNFVSSSQLHEFSSGDVRVERISEVPVNHLRLHCSAICGTLRKEVTLGWKREAGEWRLEYWSEPS